MSVAEPATGDARYTAASAAILLVAAALFLAMRLPLIPVPFERDEGEYAYIAQRMGGGELPYRDSFDQKPPGVFVAYATAFTLFGESVEAVHGFAAGWILATAWALFALVRQLTGTLAAAFAVLIFCLASADTRLGGNAANTEIFMLLPMVASLLCAIRAAAGRRPGWWWFAAGALAAAACWFKQTAATNALFVASIPVAHALRGGSGGGPGLTRALGALCLGALAVVAPVCAGFALAGAWEPFFDSVVVHNLAYARGNSLQAGLEALRFWLPRQAPSLAAFWALAAVAVFFPSVCGRRAWALLGGWLLASLLGASIGFYFRPHYFIQGLPALSALGGGALAAAATRLLDRHNPALAVAGVAALVCVAVVPPWLRAGSVRAAENPAARSRQIYGDNPFPESVEIGAYMRRFSEPGDRVYIVGSEPQVLFYAGLESATRYIFFYPLTGDYPDVLARQREVAAEVEAAQPAYVLWFNVPTSLLADENTEPFIFDHANSLLSTGYQAEVVGIPAGPRRGYELSYGPAGRQALQRFFRESPGSPFIAVYRRIR